MYVGITTKISIGDNNVSKPCQNNFVEQGFHTV